jgi:HK97 family phage prohead protease
MFTTEQRKQFAETLSGRESRNFRMTDFEMREDADGMVNFRGIASVVNTPYDMGYYQETIKAGAFSRTLNANPDVQLLINHGGLPIARTGRNMTLAEDSSGLVVDARLNPKLPLVDELRLTAGDGLIDQMSFAFRVVNQSWDEDYTQRDITEVNIHRGDVSVVNQGANPATSFSLRSLIARMDGDELADLISYVRDLKPVELAPADLDSHVVVEDLSRKGLDLDVARAQLFVLRLRAAS